MHDLRSSWPSITVVVCAYNEERRLGECLDSLTRVDYPALQVVVCDDGSTDRTLEIARRSPSWCSRPAARRPECREKRRALRRDRRDRRLPRRRRSVSCRMALSPRPGVREPSSRGGGPNLPFLDAGVVERAVALSPGNPVEVLIGDDRAEHVPGCNLAVRRSAPRASAGSTRRTRRQATTSTSAGGSGPGGQVAFSPAAQVHHHRRDSVRGYLRQQRGYGRAERMLAGQHRHRFNRWGAARWSGFVYGGPRILPRILKPVVYHGPMGRGAVPDRAARPSDSRRDVGQCNGAAPGAGGAGGTPRRGGPPRPARGVRGLRRGGDSHHARGTDVATASPRRNAPRSPAARAHVGEAAGEAAATAGADGTVLVGKP